MTLFLAFGIVWTFVHRNEASPSPFAVVHMGVHWNADPFLVGGPSPLRAGRSTELEGIQRSSMLATSEEARRSARSSIARNVFYLALGQGATTVLAVILTSVLGRSLGAADFGIYFLVVTMSASAYVLVEWGQPLFVVRETARTPARSGQLLGTALTLRVAFAIAAAIPAGLVTLTLGYGARTTWLFVLLFLASLPFSLAQGYGMVFRAYRMAAESDPLTAMEALTSPGRTEQETGEVCAPARVRARVLVTRQDLQPLGGRPRRNTFARTVSIAQREVTEIGDHEW